MGYKEKKESVWEKGHKVRGRNPEKYRKDDFGNVMYYGSYGKDTEMGWNIHHSVPQSKGGTDHLNNLKPLNTSKNKSLGNN